MTAETVEHLCQVEVPIKNAKAILSQHGYSDDKRTVMTIAMIDQLIEHHGAILLLIRSGKVGSAFALARPCVEGMYRGLWINFCATDEQLQEFDETDEMPHNMKELADEIDAEYLGEGFFADLKKRSWNALCSYAHNGMLQLGRRFTGHLLKPAYSDGEIYEVTTSTTTVILALISKFLAVQNHVESSKATEQLVESYGPAAKQPAQPNAGAPGSA
jgi:hypothetical protein